MSVERDLLKKILATGWLNNTISCEVDDLLTKPEPFKPDWANYRQGVADAKREPLSDAEIQDALIRCRQSTTWDYGFEAGVKYAEKAHGIGVDDE